MPPNCHHSLAIVLLQHRNIENGICPCSLSAKNTGNICSNPESWERCECHVIADLTGTVLGKAELWEDGLEYHGLLPFLLSFHRFS